MNKSQLRTFVEKELTKLNVKIDRMIVLGKDYRNEEKQHRALIAKLKALA